MENATSIAITIAVCVICLTAYAIYVAFGPLTSNWSINLKNTKINLNEPRQAWLIKLDK